MGQFAWKTYAAHAAIIAVPFVMLVALALHHLAPDGMFTVSAGTRDRSPYLNRILPADRAPDSTEGEWVTLVNEPAYLSVHMPKGSYETATITMEYRPRGQNVFEVGVLSDVYAQSFDLAPLMHAGIDALDWDRIVEDDRMLLVRDGAPDASIDEVLGTISDRSALAVYHEDFAVPYREWDYRPLGSRQTLDVSLRGYHKFATYIADEALDFTITYMDMNRTTGPDSGAVRVWNEAGEVVMEKTFGDDGNTTENQIESSRSTVHLAASNWPTGVYTVELSGTSDIFWRRIETAQRYVTFINRLYIGDDVGYLPESRPTSFVTNAKHLVLETFHADSPQRITVGGAEIAIPQSGEKVLATVTQAGTVPGRTPAGDIKMTGDGLFAMTAGAFFNPYPVQMNAYTDAAAQGIEYILAQYTPPSIGKDGWHTASATFDLAGVQLEKGALKFILSAPAIAEQQAALDIRRITVDFGKDPLSLREMFAAVWNALTK